MAKPSDPAAAARMRRRHTLRDLRSRCHIPRRSRSRDPDERRTGSAQLWCPPMPGGSRSRAAARGTTTSRDRRGAEWPQSRTVCEGARSTSGVDSHVNLRAAGFLDLFHQHTSAHHHRTGLKAIYLVTRSLNVSKPGWCRRSSSAMWRLPESKRAARVPPRPAVRSRSGHLAEGAAAATRRGIPPGAPLGEGARETLPARIPEPPPGPPPPFSPIGRMSSSSRWIRPARSETCAAPFAAPDVPTRVRLAGAVERTWVLTP